MRQWIVQETESTLERIFEVLDLGDNIYPYLFYALNDNERLLGYAERLESRISIVNNTNNINDEADDYIVGMEITEESSMEEFNQLASKIVQDNFLFAISMLEEALRTREPAPTRSP
jgi:hypothetical protein